MTQHLPYVETTRDDHDQSPFGGVSHPKAGGPSTADPACRPERDELVALVRLLARQAAREHLSHGG